MTRRLAHLIWVTALFIAAPGNADVSICPSAGTLEALTACYNGKIIPRRLKWYVPPTSEERTALKSVVAAMLDGGDLTQVVVPDVIKGRMTLEAFQDTDTQATYWCFYESKLKPEENTTNTWLEKGWGMFVTKPGAARELAIFAVHPLADLNTDAEAMGIFKGVDARSFFVAGAHRAASSSLDCQEVTTDADNTLADSAHNNTSFAQVATEALVEHYGMNPWNMLQFHGMAASSCSADVMLSNGYTTPTQPMDQLSTFRQNLLNKNPSWDIALQGGACIYDGATNTQGRLINGVAPENVCNTEASGYNGRFIQIEQDPLMREANDWIDPIKVTWPVVQVPAAPTTLRAVPGDAKVTLSWTASTGATSYRVKQAMNSGGPYTTVQSDLTATDFSISSGLTNGTTYYFVVSAVNSAGEGANSSEVSATPAVITHIISASAGPNGAINPSGSVQVKSGASQSFAFTPNAAFMLDTVTVDGSVVSNPPNPYTFSNVAANHTIGVSFKPVPEDPNIAPSGKGYTWSKNTAATANGNRTASSGVNNNNLTTTVSVNGGALDRANAWEALGVIWSTAKTVSSVSLLNGTLSTSGQGFFDANCTVQYTIDGTTWVESGWTSFRPAYPYDSSAANQTFSIRGPELAGVRGVRVSGQVGTHGTLPSRYFRYKEVQIFGR